MKTFKTRHQLFLTEQLSRRLDMIAKSSGRARSEILVEALEAWFDRRDAPTASEAVLARMTRMERNVARLRHSVDLLWEGVSRLIKHQLTITASLPPISEEARALGAKLHAGFINEIADRLSSVDSELLALDAEPTVQ
jgi:predicted DNA-binding protein